MIGGFESRLFYYRETRKAKSEIGKVEGFPGTKKRSLKIRANQSSSEKKSGIELLSHSQICSTIVAGPLIDRVRDGNVSYKPAMDTGKKGLKMLGLCWDED